MPLTPADVHNVAFKKPPIGKRGYDEEEVDAFLDEVERELVRLVDENGDLRARLGPGYEGPFDGGGGDDQRIRSEISNLRAHLERALREKAAAEQEAGQVQSDLQHARTQPGSALTGGSGGTETQGLRVLMMAQRTADDHVSDARQEADDLLAEARSNADRTVSEARDRADQVERDARDRHKQAVDSLDKQRNDVLREINGLSGLARDYRSRLQDAVNSQLNEMDAVPTDPASTSSRRMLDAAPADRRA